MGINAEIYLIGLSVLTFLIIVFLFIKKISGSGKLKVKIEKVSDSTNHQSFDEGAKQATLKFDDGQSEKIEDQELVIFNLISVDKSFFDVDQIIGFLSNYGAVLNNKYFSYIDEQGTEIFRVANALNPGTFEVDSKTFAIVIASNLSSVDDPVNTVKTMIEFSINFSDKFHASLCDEERTPITKQMISHIETRAQDLARLKQLKNVNNKEN
jgi:FtsZ-interacting cell division protein ZipA